MNGIKISFEKGGILYAKFLDKDLSSIENIKKKLPINTEVCHTRWCGREIFMPIKTDNKKVGSDVTRYVSKFDLVYWKKDDDNEDMETISIFYGAESLRHYGGPIYVEIIGRVSTDQEDFLENIGQRIWLEGKELITIEMY